MPIAEDDRQLPTNAYGESKLLVERMLAWLHRAHGLRYACLRYFNAAGARDADLGEDHRPESHLIPLVLRRRTRPARVGLDVRHRLPTPDGTCVRDYIHVDDLARAHLLAMAALGERGALHYNLGNGEGFSVRQVIEAARARHRPRHSRGRRAAARRAIRRCWSPPPRASAPNSAGSRASRRCATSSPAPGNGTAATRAAMTVEAAPMALFEGMSHRRRNPLTGDWVLVSPHRTQRPWLGQTERPPQPAAAGL